MKEALNTLKAVLALNFRYHHYNDAILKLRELIQDEEYYNNNWQLVIELIINRKLGEGEALNIIQNDANLLLYYNTDEEAYRWLDLMVINVLNIGVVIPYEDLEE